MGSVVDFVRPCLLLGALGALGVSAFSLWHGWLVYRGASSRRPTDVSGLAWVPPADLKPLIDDLATQGFRRLGEAVVAIPAMSTEPNSWILVDQTGTIQAEAIPFGPFLGLSTYFADRAVVTTSYPKGERIDRPELRWITVKTSVADAVREHSQAVAHASRSHGEPVRLETMADYLRWDAIDRELYSDVRLRAPFIRSAVATGATALVAASAVLGLTFG